MPLVALAVLCPDRGETTGLQHPCQAAWGRKTGPLQWRWVRRHTNTHPHEYKHSVWICSWSFFVSQRMKVKRTRLASSHGMCWSVSLSWSSTPIPRRKPGRRRRARCDLTPQCVSRLQEKINDLYLNLKVSTKYIYYLLLKPFIVSPLQY